jgi:hypothetical protein
MVRLTEEKARCYTDGSAMLYRWKRDAIPMEARCYTDGSAMLYRWKRDAIPMEARCYTDGIETLCNVTKCQQVTGKSPEKRDVCSREARRYTDAMTKKKATSRWPSPLSIWANVIP